MPISNSDDLAMWERIQSFQFDEGGERLTFARRLARENGWSAAFTGRAIDEYRKFMFLAVTAGHLVTPSDEVDQVWHLHLAYTRSYWLRWCRDVLQTDIHHGPTKGGDAEREKFQDWYARTKESYSRAFDTKPPPDLWPPAEQRFGEDVHFQRVNTARNWVVPRPRRHRALTWIAIGLLGVAIVVGCASQFGEESKSDDTFLTFIVFIGLCLILYVIGRVVRFIRGGRGGGRGDGGGCGGCSNFWNDSDDGGCDGGCGGGCGD